MKRTGDKTMEITEKWKPQRIPVADLHFDPQNPRLKAAGLDSGDAETIIEVLWKEMAADEVALSIAANGFFQYEPLFATREQGKLYVIEGNRRLAAVLLLTNPKLRLKVGATDLPGISAEARGELATLPVIVCKRDELWQFIGFKHINGPQSWQSYSKAHYIAWVHNKLGIPLPEIALRIGDQHRTAGRLYDGLMALEQAEEAGVFDREDRQKKHFAFSHLYTGLSYPGIRTFLGLPTDERVLSKRRPVPKERERQLGELLIWLFGSKKEGKLAVVQSQNPDLRNLDEVLQSESGTIALRKGLPLEVSLEISKGDERVFRESVVSAKLGLQKARGTVLTGYDKSQDLLESVKEIQGLADALIEDMERARLQKTMPRRRRGLP
jgi:hypothetical protein